MDRITTAFDADSTALEVVDGIDLTGQRAVVTGGAGNIGIETARALAAAGAEVTLAVRNVAAGEQAAQVLREGNGNANVLVRHLDLADQASVQAFVQSWSGPLNLLINNAGIMTGPLSRTPEGWEMRFATNHLGHFALTTGLHGALAAAQGARMVSVSSSGHLFSPVIFDDVHFVDHEYDQWIAYGQSKTANVLLAVEVTRRWADDGITANALTPGIVPKGAPVAISEEEMARNGRPPGAGPLPPPKTPDQGAATTLVVATSPLLDGVGGRYFEDCNESGPHQAGTRRGFAQYAVDPEAAARLWQLSLDSTGRP